LPIPTALGLYGIQRVQELGQDDALSWILMPLLGFTIAGCALQAIVYGLMTPEKWNAALQSRRQSGCAQRAKPVG
jgi:phosphate/sulfate permease